MKICHCALPALNGNNDCCKNCGNYEDLSVYKSTTTIYDDDQLLRFKENFDFLKDQLKKKPENIMIKIGIKNLEENAKKIRRNINEQKRNDITFSC